MAHRRMLAAIAVAIGIGHATAALAQSATEPEPEPEPATELKPSCFDRLARGQQLADPPAKPVVIRVGIDIIAIRKIESASETFDIDFYLVLRWHDPRLESASDPKLECLFTPDEVWSPPARLWNPRPEFINLRSSEADSSAQVEIAGDGEVEYFSRISGTFDAGFSLARFPFDTQTLAIQVESLFDRETVQLEAIPSLSGHTEAGKRWSKTMPQWRLDRLETAETDSYWVGDDDHYSRFTLSLRAKRRFGFYIWKVFVPLLLIVMLSWTVFWMSSDHFDGQMAVSITCLLALIAFNFVIGDELPKISYLTALDWAILLAYIFVFFAAIENVVIHWLDRHSRDAAALRVERLSRWVFPISYIVANVVVLIAVA